MLANEIDPSANRKALKAARGERAGNNFEVVAREWYVKYSTNWSADHGGRIIRRLERDPSADLRSALPPVKGEHFAAVTEPHQVTEILQVIEGYEGSLIVGCALRLAPLVFVRPGELRKATWVDIDFDAAEWRYIVTKTGTQHIVPLSRQSVEILKEIHPLTGYGRYVFPGARSNGRPMSDNAILAAMRRMGIGKEEMSGQPNSPPTYLNGKR